MDWKLSFWLWWGTKVVGWEFIDIRKADDEENVEAITFSNSEKYIDEVEKIE